MRYREILEYVIADNAEQKATADLARDMDRDDECWPRLDWRIDQGRDPYEEGDDEESEEFKQFLYDWCENRVDHVAGEIDYCFEGDRIRVWRVITAPRDWTPEGRHPGIYWSWDEDAAEAHWGQTGNFMVQWTLEAVVETKDIDWVATLYMNAHPSYSEEKEIRLKEGTPVKLLSVSHDGDLEEASEPKVIKLRGFNPAKINPDSPASKWMREFDAMCTANPLNDNALVFKDQAVVVVGRSISQADTAIELRDIRAITKGGGANCLKTMCEIADKHGTQIDLHAKGYSHVPTERLVPYYCKFGFEPEDEIKSYDDGVPMRRMPR